MRPTDAIGADASFPATPHRTAVAVQDAPVEQVALAGGVGAADLCRITVHGPDGRADLAIPAAATFGLLLPVLARHVNRGQDEGKDWVLQRLGEPPPAYRRGYGALYLDHVLQAHEVRVGVEPVPRGAAAARAQEPDLVVVVQGPHRHAEPVGHLPDGECLGHRSRVGPDVA